MRKNELIAGLTSARENILNVAKTIPDERRDEIFLGIWSVKDLLSHLIGWDYANLDSVKDIRAGQTPRIFQHYDEEWRSFNAQLVKQYKREDWNELLDAIQLSHRELIALLETIPDDDLNRDFGVRSPGGRVITIQRHLQAEIDDEHRHYGQMADWFGKQEQQAV